MNDKPIDVKSEPVSQPQTQAVTVRDAVAAIERLPEQKLPMTAAQAKVEAVANLTMKAYERAGTLELKPEEIQALQASFPDEAFKPGAAGKEHLIYIEHAFLRDRLNEVIGPGQWALIPRSRWAEDFVTMKGQPASRVYVEAMLVVRGAFVSEAVGEMEYYPKNASQNYGDAVEGAKTAALRRCCKEFGIGLQAWKKDFCEGWWQRRRSGTKPLTTVTNPALTRKLPEQPAAAQPAEETVCPVVEVLQVSERSGTKRDGKPWTAWFILLDDGVGKLEAGTFSKSVGDLAKELSDTHEKATATVKPSAKQAGKFELVSLARAEQPPTTKPDVDEVPMEFDEKGQPVEETIP